MNVNMVIVGMFSSQFTSISTISYLRLGVRAHTDASRAPPKSLVVVDPDGVRFLLDHGEAARENKRNTNTNEKRTSNIKKTNNGTK